MVENFKITAIDLKRKLNISVYLPNDYNSTDRAYPVIYVLDGQQMFHSLDESNKEFDLPEIMDKEDIKAILVGIHAPTNPLWRTSELVPYFIPDGSIVDPTLAPIFSNYIVNDLTNIINERYRVLDGYRYIMGFNEGAILALFSLFHSNIFTGAALFSPKLNICNNEQIIEDLYHNLKINKNIYIYYGKNDDTTLCDNLVKKLNELNIKTNYISKEFDGNLYYFHKRYIAEAINYLIDTQRK